MLVHIGHQNYTCHVMYSQAATVSSSAQLYLTLVDATSERLPAVYTDAVQSLHSELYHMVSDKSTTV